MKGRTSYVTTVQYDATRLVADGTMSLVVLHDFSEEAAAADSAGRDFKYVFGGIAGMEENESND